jgi:hypothetical protein
MQCMQFRARSAKKDFEPMDLLKHNFYFETEGVYICTMLDRTIPKLEQIHLCTRTLKPNPH